MGPSERTAVRRFTADEALRMVDAGILRKDEPVELLDGVLVEMSPQGPEHAVSTRRLVKRLRTVYVEGAEVLEEKPLAANKHDLPEPDVTVVRSRSDDYLKSHPTGRDAILVVELAWSSQSEDRRKAATYAAGG